ncbi:MAG: TPM domain-containing protein [Clostridia bacterium]|nr:TPM domain-containing protein [Clostridia bacterium]
MKNNLFRKTPLTALALLLIVTMMVLPVFAAVSVPKHDNYIADDAQLLSEGTIRNITSNNKTLWDKNGTTIGICTVKTIGDEDIGTYARRVYTEWGMGKGVLILVAKEENCFHLVQSEDVETDITNEDLEMLRDDYMEKDFAASNIDRAVFSTATKLTTMLSEVRDSDAPAAVPETDSTETDETDEEKGTTVGSVIVGILKFILIAALILIALFIILFVAALFNDDVAELMRKYVFQRGKSTSSPSDFYDERLYGTNHQIQQRGRQNAQRAAQQNRQRPPQNRPYNPQQQYRGSQTAVPPARQIGTGGYPQQQNRQNPYPRNSYAQQNAGAQQRPVMYNADGSVRRPRPAQQRQQAPQTQPRNRQEYQNNPQPRNPRQNYQQPADDGATQMFSLHDPNNY